MSGSPQKMPLLVLVGPTAVGKTKFSLDIARTFRAEIISGDSMQVYRGMDIGTAKASPQERALVPHHLIDIRDPDEPFSVSDFQRLAKEAIADIHSRGKLPFVVGGTGLYIEALCYDFHFSRAGMDREFREKQRKIAAEQGLSVLFGKLREIDPQAAERIHPNDERRIIRALEVHHVTGQPFSAFFQKNRQSPFDLLLIGLTMDRDLLYKRIEERVDRMIASGLVEEVKRLLAAGCGRNLNSMQGLGYKEIAAYLHGECSLDEAVALLKRNTRRFAKRQLSWFRHMDEIRWVDVSETEKYTTHLKQLSGIIAGKFRHVEEYTE
jgi:tRNA dimethylallyltransferase